MVDSCRKDKESALKMLRGAIYWDLSFKAEARKDEAFKWLWEEEEFKKLVK